MTVWWTTWLTGLLSWSVIRRKLVTLSGIRRQPTFSSALQLTYRSYYTCLIPNPYHNPNWSTGHIPVLFQTLICVLLAAFFYWSPLLRDLCSVQSWSEEKAKLSDAENECALMQTNKCVYANILLEESRIWVNYVQCYQKFLLFKMWFLFQNKM